MRTLLIKKEGTKLGYALKVVNNDGTETITEITATDPKNPKVLKLPDNPANRKWITPRGDDVQELEYKESKSFGPRTTTGATTTGATITTSTRFDWTEYLDDEDKKTIKALKEKALNRKKVADLKAAIDELTKQYNELTKLAEKPEDNNSEKEAK